MISAVSIAKKWFWGLVAMFFVVLSIGLALALIVVTRQRDGLLNTPSSSSAAVHRVNQTVKHEVCGSTVANKNIDLAEPTNPGPFHDLTAEEIRQLRKFLEQRPDIKAARPGTATVTSSFIYAVDIMVPKKSEVIAYLSKSGSPDVPRYARVVMFRGDKSPPVVEEWKCGPLQSPESCQLLTMNDTMARNPVEFSLRPLSSMELDRNGAFKYLINTLEHELGSILKESFNASFSDCSIPEDCLTFTASPVNNELVNNLVERQIWISLQYNLPYPTLHPVGMSILCHVTGADPTKWSFSKIWYSGQLFTSAAELKLAYNSQTVPKMKMNRPVDMDSLFSDLHRRGDPQPVRPQRPPTTVEPDGKRYSLKNRKVTYLNWSFHFRMSSINGPVLYDVKFQGERIAYEIALNELATFYSGLSPLQQTANFVHGGSMADQRYRSLVPGADCPDTATLVNQSSLNMFGESPSISCITFCLFEHNNGLPLRRHLSYTVSEGGFYGGMLDSVLILRSVITVMNSDNIIDFIFHQNGALQTRVAISGYIVSNVYRESDRPYGLRIGEAIMGHLHHHMVNFKVDLDIAGVNNRYQTLNIVKDIVNRTDDKSKIFYQNKLIRTLQTTELNAKNMYKLSSTQHHIVFNNSTRNAYNENRGYRIIINSKSDSLLLDNKDKDRTVPWARHQFVVTSLKDSELRSSSIYGMFDRSYPVVNFSQFYEDDEDIVDKDLVLWITAEDHHIPRAEDVPLVSTVGRHMGFTLLPFNYHNECPSMSSRDAIYIKHKNPDNLSEGLTVNRQGNDVTQCLVPVSRLESDLNPNPDGIIETKHSNFNY